MIGVVVVFGVEEIVVNVVAISVCKKIMRCGRNDTITIFI